MTPDSWCLLGIEPEGCQLGSRPAALSPYRILRANGHSPSLPSLSLRGLGVAVHPMLFDILICKAIIPIHGGQSVCIALWNVMEAMI